MPPEWKNRYYDSIIGLAFAVLLVGMLLVTGSGLAWSIVEAQESAFWLSVLVAMLATTSGIVATYSFVRYTQQPNLRSLIIMFLGANVVLFSFAYLVTHPIISLSVVSTRDRNRTIVSGLGFLLTPGVLAGSVPGDAEITTKKKRFVILWGAVLQPLSFVFLLISPVPLFRVTDPQGGLFGLTPVGLILTGVVGGSATLALLRYMLEWYRSRSRTILASTLALVLWIGAFIIYTVLEDPHQIAEILWLGGIFAGFVILALGMILTSIIEPHRVLESLVERRTEELRAARRESDFYLHMWAHKMGNLLQGIVTYLELLSHVERTTSQEKPYKEAVALSNEATLFNRQVSKLSEIKSAKDVRLVPVVAHTYLMRGLETVRQTFRERPVSAKVAIDKSLIVRADMMLTDLFANLIIQAYRLAPEDDVELKSSGSSQNGVVNIYIESRGRSLSDGDERFLTSSDLPELSTLNIQLYAARILIDRYGGQISYFRRETENKNIFRITLDSG